MRKIILLAALMACAAGARAKPVNSQAGTSGAQFLKLGSGARAGGMADSFAALADDVSAAYYNPAGLTQLSASQIAGAHTSYFQDVNYEVMQFAYPFGREERFSRHALALGIYYLSVSNIERRVSDSTDPIGTFGAGDGAYALSYAYAFDRQLSVGVTGKYIAQTLDTYRASSFGADLGVHYKLNPNGARPMNAAFVLRNFGTRPGGFVSGQSDPMPVSGTLALSMEVLPKTLKLDVEGTKYRDASAFASAGGEYTLPLTENIAAALRSGYSTQRSSIDGFSGLTVGGGLSFHNAGFDFAWVPFGDLGDTFRYSLVVKF